MVERMAVLEGHAWMRDTRFLGVCMPCCTWTVPWNTRDTIPNRHTTVKITAMLQVVVLGRYGHVTRVRLVAHSMFVMGHVSMNVRCDEPLCSISLRREGIGTRELGKNMGLPVER